MTPVVGLVGKAGCGKTTFANRLREHYGYVSYNFANPLKTLCCEQFGWNRRALDEDDAAQVIGYPSALEYKEGVDPALGVTRRFVLQHIGTEGFRAIDPNHWVKQAVAEIRRLQTIAAHGVVIPDVRFLNEIASIRNGFGGVVILLRRPGDPDGGTELSGHVSEQEWQSIDPDYAFAPQEGVDCVHDAVDDFVGWQSRGCPVPSDL